MITPTAVRFLNESGDITDASAWDDRRRSHLWLYNLHYFEDLTACGAEERRTWHQQLIARWIAENRPSEGVGWEPYPTSVRIVNWIKAGLGGLALEQGALDSLATQARWLAGRVETHLLGNHLLANAKALVFAGSFFEGAEAERWRTQGLSIYAEQLPEQILSDGGHFERSPMYHAIILEDLLDLTNVASVYGFRGHPVFASLPPRILTMRRWLEAMSHPDGRISFFNDAAFGIAAEPHALAAYARRLGLPEPRPVDGAIVYLESSGYLRMQLAQAVVLLDLAPVGPDYLPGHAHADTLSFEFSLGETRVLVNGGTSVYGVGAQRHLERSTATHSTVEIDGENSSEVWEGFRVGRRARVRDVAVEQRPNALCVSAAHDGYRWRPGRPLHRRRWELSPGRFSIADVIEGPTRCAIARFHFGPGVSGSAGEGAQSGQLALPGRSISWRTSSAARIEPDEWRPEFGLRIPTQQLVAPLELSALQTQFTW